MMNRENKKYYVVAICSIHKERVLVECEDETSANELKNSWLSDATKKRITVRPVKPRFKYVDITKEVFI